MSEPNTRLRAVRRALRMSQAELARKIREAGQQAGEPNSCTQQQIQRWENGTTKAPYGHYLRALEMVTGQPAENLGFATDRYGVDVGALAMPAEGTWQPDTGPQPAAPLNGIWLSRYEYESSSRGAMYSNAHYVMVIQHGPKLQVRSLPGTTPGRMLMDLTVNGAVLTGMWTEETNPGGYYQGATYYGAIQMLLEPSGHRMSGKWLGFGRDFDVNVGPWTLELITTDTTPASIEAHSRPAPRGQ